jgi:high-affinity nickel permease
MEDLLLAVSAGLILGGIHAFDADHVVAVTAFAAKNPGARKAALFGVLWGLGHTTILMVFGMACLALQFIIPPAVETFAELLVGAMLLAIGTWVLKDVFLRKRIHIHKHTHDGVEHIHVHSHEEREDHRHRHSMFFVGAAHGFAGTAAVLVVIPVTISGSLVAALVYMILFGIGTMAAMAVFAYALGHTFLLITFKNAMFWVQGIAGSMSILLGSWWILERLL